MVMEWWKHKFKISCYHIFRKRFIDTSCYLRTQKEFTSLVLQGGKAPFCLCFKLRPGHHRHQWPALYPKSLARSKRGLWISYPPDPLKISSSFTLIVAVTVSTGPQAHIACADRKCQWQNGPSVQGDLARLSGQHRPSEHKCANIPAQTVLARALPSDKPRTMAKGSGEKVLCSDCVKCRSQTCPEGSPVLKSQSLTSASKEAVATVAPSGLNKRNWTHWSLVSRNLQPSQRFTGQLHNPRTTLLSSFSGLLWASTLRLCALSRNSRATLTRHIPRLTVTRCKHGWHFGQSELKEVANDHSEPTSAAPWKFDPKGTQVLLPANASRPSASEATSVTKPGSMWGGQASQSSARSG